MRRLIALLALIAATAGAHPSLPVIVALSAAEDGDDWLSLADHAWHPSVYSNLNDLVGSEDLSIGTGSFESDGILVDALNESAGSGAGPFVAAGGDFSVAMDLTYNNASASGKLGYAVNLDNTSSSYASFILELTTTDGDSADLKAVLGIVGDRYNKTVDATDLTEDVTYRIVVTVGDNGEGSRKMYLYIDGVSAGSTAIDAQNPQAPDDIVLTIGTASGFLDITADRIAWYDEALSPEEVADVQ